MDPIKHLVNCKVFSNVRQEEDEAAWKVARNKGIGGSDIGPIMGVSPFTSARQVYMQKTGQYPAEFEPGKAAQERMRFGHLLEPVVAQEFAARTGLNIVQANATLVHKDYNWAFANVDRLIVDNNDVPYGVLEVKTASEYQKDEWDEGEIMLTYIYQLQWYLFVTGLQVGHDHGTGLDNYDVKRSLGAGAAAPFVGGTLILNSNFTGHEVLDNGPLRTSFRLTYPEIEINGAPASETRTFTLDAGSQLTRVDQQWGVTEPISAAVGFTLRPGEAQYGAAENLLMVGEPDNAKVSGVYLGAVLPENFGDPVLNEYEIVAPVGAGVYRHALAVVPYTPGTPLTYYTGFGWEKWGDWTSDSFADYLAAFATALKTPFVVNYK